LLASGVTQCAVPATATAIRFGDVLVTAAGVLRESCRLAADRMAADHGIPGAAAGVTAGWLTSALAGRFPGVLVRRVHTLAADAGTTQRARLAVTYDDLGRGDAPPESMFVKLAPADLRTRLFVNMLRLGSTEARFYRVLARDVPVDVARVFHVGSGRAGRFVLVLEDLAARGVRFADVSQPLTLETARLVMRALARLHAAFWESARFQDDLAWLERGHHDATYRIGRLLSAVAVKPMLARFGDLVPAALRAAAGQIAEARDRLEAAWARPPCTVIHGDAHAGNLYYPPGGVGFLDWQVVQRGQGMRDVTYFLVHSLSTELRREREGELIDLYRATLGDHGIVPPHAEAAREQYRLHALYAWIAAAVTSTAATLQSEAIVRTGLARSSTAVVDLDSLAALKYLPG
jgi:aminoglycoside phosphotransferase (APT) family kinase protein